MSKKTGMWPGKEEEALPPLIRKETVLLVKNR
jgi:hypothetical protein